MTSVAAIYRRIIETKDYRSFFGSRDFYSIIKLLCREARGLERDAVRIDDKIVLRAFMRNFGGQQVLYLSSQCFVRMGFEFGILRSNSEI